ncbi:hypothetical protein ACN28S_15130 [Cystobacter fuscus]
MSDVLELALLDGAGGIGRAKQRRSNTWMLGFSVRQSLMSPVQTKSWGWTIALIVSAELKEALERMGATGAKFKEV